MKSLSKIKILYIGPIPPEVGGQTRGGVATHCWELANQAYKNGYEVYIWTNITSSFNKEGINIVRLQSRNKLIKLFYTLNSYLANRKKINYTDILTLKEKIIVFYKAYLLKEVIKYIKPDIIHILHILDDINLSLSALEEYPPVVVTEYGVALLYKYSLHEMYRIKEKDFLLRRVEEAFKKVCYIISSSNFSKSSLLDTFNLPSHVQIKAILLPVDSDKMPLLNREEEKKALELGNKRIIFFCGTHLPFKRKGLDILLRTVANDKYLRENCKVLVITNEKEKALAQKFIITKNIDGQILGPQPWEKLIKYYNAADIFVMPSRQEGIGLVYYEALLAGVPVVGFYKSVEELEKVLDIYIGEKFDASRDDEVDLAKKIKKVLDLDFDRQILRDRVINRLSWDSKFQEFDSVYREILENRK